MVSYVRVDGCPRSIQVYGHTRYQVYVCTYVDVRTLPGRCTEQPTATLLVILFS